MTNRSSANRQAGRVRRVARLSPTRSSLWHLRGPEGMLRGMTLLSASLRAPCWANALLDYGLARRYRLRVRTGPSQGSDRGSNPRSATISPKPS